MQMPKNKVGSETLLGIFMGIPFILSLISIVIGVGTIFITGLDKDTPSWGPWMMILGILGFVVFGNILAGGGGGPGAKIDALIHMADENEKAELEGKKAPYDLDTVARHSPL